MFTFFQPLVATYKDKFFYTVLSWSLKDCASVLDVGCGASSSLQYIKKTFFSEGIDAFKTSIAKSKRLRIHDRYVLGDIRRLKRWYKPKSFDAVIAIDVIEHLKKKEALTLMKNMESIARKKIVLLTPNGFYHQDAYDHNPYQIHQSGWKLQDLSSLGYQVYGLRGLKEIRGEYTTIRWKPWLLWGIIAFISEPLCFFFPRLSYDLFAIKTISE